MVCHLKLMLRGYYHAVEKTLQTDCQGRVRLGTLANVRRVSCEVVPQGDVQVKPLKQDLSVLPRATLPKRFQLLEGERARLPSCGLQELYLKAGRHYLSRLTDRLVLEEGATVLQGLEPGTYELLG